MKHPESTVGWRSSFAGQPLKVHRKDRNKRYGPPMDGWRVFVDARLEGNRASWGAAIFDGAHQIDSDSGVFGALSSTFAETFALVKGLGLARDLELNPVRLFTDDQSLVLQYYRYPYDHSGWRITDLLHSARLLGLEIGEVSVAWVPRRFNRTAHLLAREAARDDFHGGPSESD